ncbi:dipeptidase [Thalassoglobus polymorphus]|uniref:Membrane dipeptidase (Peptidase family M19) n=1 Tax=Thalassoglobus polymorphus TaxID=2527994 RepID=A0A517QPK3_9PLAN|nr:dipeptidase [Thalassoglobus polymorphus]QDT33517.1 Membrane dipeptidase (Peptidase family M19) [Thalassoglobus polymorphus]
MQFYCPNFATSRRFSFLALMIFGSGLMLNGSAGVAAEPATVSPEVRKIHNEGMLFDGHNDLPWQIRKLASGSFEKLDISKPQPELHTDIPRLAKSGLKAQFWSVYVSGDTIDSNDSLLRTLEQIDVVHNMYKKYPDHFEAASTTDDIQRIIKSGKIASMMGVEGGHSIEGSLQMLNKFYDDGVRYMTLTHNRSLDWAGSCNGDPDQGLSPFGEEVVREMNRLGMLVDLSHVSIQTMRDALQVTKAPVIFSHSSARAICDHPRNVPDDILKLLPENGGVVMINFFPTFIVPTEILKKDKNALGDLGIVVDHIEHVIKIAGIDHVGIGSDFDGVSKLPVGLEDVSTYPAITEELVQRGYSAEEIHKILGGNIFRALKDAEEVAKSLNKNQD